MPRKSSQKYLKNHPKTKSHTLLNELVLAMAIVAPLFTLPQVYNIWIRDEAAGVSMATWGFFIVSAVIWLLYGLTLKNIPLIVSSTLWALLDCSVALGLIIR
jgi:uncharacterized protein with PQ loop repeat